MIFHSNGTTLKGAWVALSMFFVLSGFLITSMLLAEGDRFGRASLGNFYLRRATRLLPPLLLTVALLGIYAAIVPVADAASRLWGDSLASIFYFADYRSAFGHEPFLGYLGQAWSLSVEEQFYIIWSVLLVLTIAWRKRWLAYVLAIVGIVAATADRLWIVFHAPSYPGVHDAVAARVYYAFDTRADALFFGCLLGLLASQGIFNNWRPWMQRVLAVAALASGALMIWVAWNIGLLYRSLPVMWMTVTEITTAILIAYFVVRPKGIGSKVVGVGILVYVGNLSYMIYLVHWAVYLELNPERFHWGFWPVELARLAIVFAIASLSWFLMERPLMRWRRNNAPERREPPETLAPVGSPAPAQAPVSLGASEVAASPAAPPPP